MSDDDSNDVVMVEDSKDSTEVTSTDTETRPIMQLFQRLISNDNKQNTILTNAQITAILHKEFNMNVNIMHELEIDIYVNTVKRFLKDWPKWDEFDESINNLRKKNAYKSIRKTLEVKYLDLKSYLRIQLGMTMPLAKKAVDKLIHENSKRMEKVDTSEITLEVYCTRKQLNELVLSQPISGGVENTVFNLTEFIPTSITVNKVPIESIINWFGVQVTIDTKALFYQRATNHQIKHVLVNSKNGPRTLVRELKSEIQIKEIKQRVTEDINKEKILKKFEKLLQSEMIQRNNQIAILKPFIDILVNDLHYMTLIKVPATYRQYSSKYPYYRKLRKEVEPNNPSSSYYLYVEETLAPMHVFQIGKGVSSNSNVTIDNPFSFIVECIECKMKFSGDEMYSLLREHFDVYHSNEPDWNCTNCEKTFSMTELARNKWAMYGEGGVLPACLPGPAGGEEVERRLRRR